MLSPFVRRAAIQKLCALDGITGFMKECVAVSPPDLTYSPDLSVPPRPPVIVDEFGEEVTSGIIGPYAEGATSNISCEVNGGMS